MGQLHQEVVDRVPIDPFMEPLITVAQQTVIAAYRAPVGPPCQLLAGLRIEILSAIVRPA
jgi:hypothetical protein